jgi:hypothetical protein
MSDAILADAFAMLCDGRGSTWTSEADLPVKVGEFIGDHLAAPIGHVVRLRTLMKSDA